MCDGNLAMASSLEIEHEPDCEFCGKNFLQSELNEFNLCPECESDKQEWIKDMYEANSSDIKYI